VIKRYNSGAKSVQQQNIMVAIDWRLLAWCADAKGKNSNFKFELQIPCFLATPGTHGCTTIKRENKHVVDSYSRVHI
jgi:hypothetical protein